MFALIGTLAILARITNVVLRRRKAWYDDYAMLAAYIFSVACMIASYVSVQWGVGLELEDAPPYWATRVTRVGTTTAFDTTLSATRFYTVDR